MDNPHGEVPKHSQVQSNGPLNLKGASGSSARYFPWQLFVILSLSIMFILGGVYVMMPHILSVAGNENVILGLVFTALLFITLGILVIRDGTQKSRKLRRKLELLGIQNRVIKEDLEKIRGVNEALLSAKKKDHDIINSIRDVILETDETGKLVFLNNSWQVLTGFDIEQSVGQSLFSVLHTDDQQGVKQEFADLLKGRKDRYRGFAQVRRADGTFGAIELSLAMVAKGRDGEARFAGTVTDIEERRRAERALAEAEKKYRNIVQHAAGGIYQLTPEGLYLSANPALARILGFNTPEQLLREVKNANDSVYVDMEAREGFVKKLEVEKNNFQQEIQVTRRDGSVIWVSESARAVRDETGRMLFIEGSMEDITERKESEIRIREAKIQSDLANRAKSEFLSNMSHELRTPLNSIIGFSEMIKNEVFGPVGQPAYWEYAKDIYESGQGLLRVINEILDISKIEAGERQLNETVVSIKSVVSDCVGLLEHKVENNGLTVTTSLESAPDIVGEELSIKQILMNLLSNAIKFTPDEGRITISSLMDQDGRFHLSISDTGVGLDEEGIKKALSPFGQVNSEHSRSGSGTGLGLTLVSSLIRLHGGEFDLFSQKGIGTTATVIFPANRVTGKVAKPVRAEEAPQDAG